MTDAFASQSKDNAAGGSPTLTSLTDQIEPVEGDIELMKRVLATAGARPDLIPTPLLAYLADYLGGGGNLSINTNQIAGFARFTANVAVVTTAESTNNTGFTDLATVGPELTQIPDGNYLILFGAQAYTDTVSAGFAAQIAPQVNSDAIPAQDRITTPTGDYLNITGFTTHQCKGGSNTIKLLYRSSGGPAATAHFQNRVLIALRYANL